MNNPVFSKARQGSQTLVFENENDAVEFSKALHSTFGFAIRDRKYSWRVLSLPGSGGMFLSRCCRRGRVLRISVRRA